MKNGLMADTSLMNTEGRATIASSEEFATEVNNLKNQKTELLGIWHGPSAKAFEESADSHFAFMDRFQGVLNEMGEKIVSGSNRLEQTETENEEASRRLQENSYNGF